MAAAIDIANRALVLLGEERITSLDDGTKGAATCKSQYDLTRLSELRAHRWGFAMKRARIPASATAPVFGFQLSYPFPNDLVRLDYVGDYFVGASLTPYRMQSEAAFAIEGRNILTNMAAPLNIRYVWNITDAGQFDALFVDAFGHRLAIDICLSLTNSVQKKTGLAQAYTAVIDEAVTVNAVERPPEPLPDQSWMLSRL